MGKQMRRVFFCIFLLLICIGSYCLASSEKQTLAGSQITEIVIQKNLNAIAPAAGTVARP
jgi:hypothetical protein